MTIEILKGRGHNKKKNGALKLLGYWSLVLGKEVM
jgi:hypothetical protein